MRKLLLILTSLSTLIIPSSITILGSISNQSVTEAYSSTYTEYNEKIDLSTIKTNNVEIELGPISNQTPDEIKKYILLEIGKQNSNQIVNDVVISVINSPDQWDVLGIKFVVPPKGEEIKYNSAHFLAKDWNDKYSNSLFVDVTLTNSSQDIVQDITLQAETWGAGKSWGTGSAYILDKEAKLEIDLTQFGGEAKFRGNYDEIILDVYGEYYFKKGKKIDWDVYHKQKKKYNNKTHYNVALSLKNLKENPGNWFEVENQESEEGGYKWGNYYKSWVKAEFINGKLVIDVYYRLAAYGVGANKYWSAGTIGVDKIQYISKK